MKATNETFKNVKDLVHRKATPEEREFVEAFSKLSAERQIIKHLVGLRAAQDKSQADIADAMGCTQSRVSKFESDKDDNLRLGDLHGYLSALGFDLRLVFARTNLPIAQAIKLQWQGLLRLLSELTDLCGNDLQMTREVANIHGQLASDFLNVVIALSKKIDGIAPSSTAHPTKIEVLDIDAPSKPDKAVPCAAP